jgi:hypothetical protein
MTDTPHARDSHDPGHLLTIDEWEEVVQRAERIVRGEERMLALGRSSFPSVTGFVQARWYGASQTPTFGVLHDAETPLSRGYAGSIAHMFSTTSVQKSAHFMVDPGATFQLLDTSLTAWHCGNGNRRSVGVEQAGYAAFSRPQWLTADGVAQMDRVAALMRDLKAAHGIGTYWMTDAQLVAAYNGAPGGWATHHQCARVLKGTTHTDPDPNYPYADLMARANGGAVPAPQPTPIIEEGDGFMFLVRNVVTGSIDLVSDDLARSVHLADGKDVTAFQEPTSKGGLNLLAVPLTDAGHKALIAETRR